MSDDLFVLNGVNTTRGIYLTDPLPAADVNRLAQGRSTLGTSQYGKFVNGGGRNSRSPSIEWSAGGCRRCSDCRVDEVGPNG
jgi:hypothetical protein